MKSPKTENVRRGWTHVVGLVKTGLMVVMAQMATNVRLLRGWAERTGDRTDPVCRADPPDYGFEEVGPEAPRRRPAGRPRQPEPRLLTVQPADIRSAG